jgi:L-histidine Nalpha-methyltransferase / hercynylcysteine S-oxide synthase
MKSSSLALYLLERPTFTFPRISLTPIHRILNPTGTPYGIPSLSEFRDVWKAWDTVTLGMIPNKMLHEKPIDLRHKILFYLGHIPTYVTIVLASSLTFLSNACF